MLGLAVMLFVAADDAGMHRFDDALRNISSVRSDAGFRLSDPGKVFFKPLPDFDARLSDAVEVSLDEAYALSRDPGRGARVISFTVPGFKGQTLTCLEVDCE